MPVSPPVITIGALPFTHSKLTVERTLKAFEERLGRLVRSDLRQIGYTPDWATRHNWMATGEPKDTPEDRVLWFRRILGTAMAHGMDLATTGEPDPVEVVWAVARWAHGALLHIQDLEGQVRRLTGEQIAADMKHAEERRALELRISELNAAVNRADQMLREAGEREADMAVKLGELHRVREQRDRTVDQLRTEIGALSSDVKRADSERDAWRAAAQSANSALDTLRAALRIPSGPAEVVNLPDPANVARTALVRR